MAKLRLCFWVRKFHSPKICGGNLVKYEVSVLPPGDGATSRTAQVSQPLPVKIGRGFSNLKKCV